MAKYTPFKGRNLGSSPRRGTNMLLTQFKTYCIVCKKTMRRFTGFEEVALIDGGQVRPLCKKCSDKIREFIVELINEDC